MKKILSTSKMIEKLRIQPKKGPERIIVFENEKKGKGAKPTELSDEDFNYLKNKENGPFTWFIDKGIFIVIDSDEEDPEPSKLDKAIKSLQGQKTDQESKGKVFHHKAQAKLEKLLKEKEEVKTMQGE